MSRRPADRAWLPLRACLGDETGPSLPPRERPGVLTVRTAHCNLQLLSRVARRAPKDVSGRRALSPAVAQHRIKSRPYIATVRPQLRDTSASHTNRAGNVRPQQRAARRRVTGLRCGGTWNGVAARTARGCLPHETGLFPGRPIASYSVRHF